MMEKKQTFLPDMLCNFRLTDSIKKIIPEIIILAVYIVGTIGHLFEPARTLMLQLTPAALLVSGFAALFPLLKEKNQKILIWILLVYGFTFLLETAGVHSGLLFGNYSYGSTLGFKLFDVPLIIGFNWVLVITGALFLSRKIFKNDLAAIILSAMLAVMFDFFLEPVAIKLDYWNWQNRIIPLQNYAAWFLITFLISFSFVKLKIKQESQTLVIYFIIQLIFIVTLNLCM